MAIKISLELYVNPEDNYELNLRTNKAIKEMFLDDGLIIFPTNDVCAINIRNTVSKIVIEDDHS